MSTRAVEIAARPEPPRDAWDRLLIAAIFGGMLGLGYAAFATPLLQPLFSLAERGEWSALWIRPTVIWIAMGLFLLLMRTLLWLRYRPFAAAALEKAPLLSVIIPAYNEGAMVEDSIASVAAARYPPGRLEIIAIDDGSTDDTWRYIERAARRFPDLVRALRLAKNGGKRAALAEGFGQARGEILVTVDSDHDGKMDRWQRWSNRRIVREELDIDGDGAPDRRLRYGPVGNVVAVEPIRPDW